MKIIGILFCATWVLFAGTLDAQEDCNPALNQSPYFLIEKEQGTAQRFPLLSTWVKVDLVGPIANVTVKQLYKNDGPIPIEAIYIFPASTRSAVYELEMVIGDRIIRAEIQEKNQARKIYQKAKEEGRRTSLLEQERPNIFKMNVANILPGDIIQVTMRYNEFLIPENNEYQFVYPTVVGPRYTSDKDRGQNESYAANPYLKAGHRSPSLFDIEVKVRMTLPISSATCVSHGMNILFENKNQATARLMPQEKHGGNRDFIFNYQVSGKSIGTGTWLYEHDDEKFFLTTIEPPAKLSQSDILPREYIFVIDVSGSMHGFPLATSKALLRDLVSRLRPDDYFNMLLFAGDNQLLSDTALSATKENISFALRLLDQLEGGGGTELLAALRLIQGLPKACPELSRSIVIITDGYITVEQEVFQLISKTLLDANVFSFGIGSGVNRYLIEGLAHVGRGEAFIVTKPELAKEVCDRFIKYIERPFLSNIRVSFENFDAYDIVPATIPDLFAERPLFVFGKFRGSPTGEIVMTGNTNQGPFKRTQYIKPSALDSSHIALRYLWAREKIRWNQDFNQLSSDPDLVAKITSLGLKYHLLTDYTSFVGVEERDIINPDGISVRIRQPLPLPMGVSNYAVGFDMGAEGVMQIDEEQEKIHIVAQCLTEIDPRRKQILEQFFTEDMKSWGNEVLEHFSGKTMEISLTDPMRNIVVRLDGKLVVEMHRRYILMTLLRLKWPVFAGDKLVLQICPVPKLLSTALEPDQK